uniref:Major facilitator superfamily (MFS) profile domain-containing protein n=1 Tax=Timema shepardi TaxID=629360 RepID=A0A7R9B854_TIMSH|nr:unnamed protein product [Timema shepardi]
MADKAVGEKWQPLNGVWPQHMAAILATLCSMSGGIVMGWSTPAVPYLQELHPLNDGTNATTIPITDEEGSWLGSLSAAGALLGAILYWIPLLYLARVISGIGVGGATTITPVYNEEISELRTRGKIGIYNEIMLCNGVLFAFYVGAYASYLCFHIVSCSVPVFFFCAFVWMPESPIYLLMKERTEDAEKSLRWLREAGDKPDKRITEELEKMKLFVEHSLNDSGAKQKVPLLKTIRSALPNLSYSSPLTKASVIVFGLQILQQLSGSNAVLYYTVTLFKDAGSSLSPYDSSIIVGAIQVFSACVSSRIVDLTGRRPLLLISEGSATLFPALLGLYFYWKESGDVSGFTWIPLVIVNLFILTFEVGFGPLPSLLMAELSPAESKGFITGLGLCSNWILVFIITKTYTNMVAGIGLPMTYGLYAIFSGIGMVFIYFLVPETKGKTREEIQHELKFGKSKHDNKIKNERSSYTHTTSALANYATEAGNSFVELNAGKPTLFSTAI